jgi:hypothetical protein
MLKVELISLTTPPQAFVLCNSTKALAEHNLRLNGQRVIDYVSYVRAEFAKGFDQGNRRTVFSFDVTRDCDFSDKTFRDPEAAFAWALDQEMQLPTLSHCRITIASDLTNTVRWIDNATVQALPLNRVLGVALTFNYTINGGRISVARPAIE